MKKQQKVPHPGSACCDPSQDLGAWLAGEEARIAELRAQAATIRTEAKEADANALSLAVHGTDRQAQGEAENARRVLHGRANALAQSAMIKEGHIERVRAAHLWRL